MLKNTDFHSTLNDTSVSVLSFRNALGITKVTEACIFLDHTKFRIDTVNIYAHLLLGFPLLISILSYNQVDIIQLVVTVFCLILVRLLYTFRFSIWHKTITFDVANEKVIYQRSFPKKKVVLNAKDVVFFSKVHKTKYDTSDYYYIKHLKDGKHYSLFTRTILSSDRDKEKFIKLLIAIFNSKLISKETPKEKSSSIPDYEYEVCKAYAKPFPQEMLDSDMLFDTIIHENWTIFQYVNDDMKNKWTKYCLSDGSTVYMLTDSNGVGYQPPDDQKVRAIVLL